MKQLLLVIFLAAAGTLFAYRTPDRAIQVYKAPATPVIDGEEDEAWKDAQAFAVTQADPSTGFSEIESGEDYAAWFKVMWDENNLYFFVYVMDDVLFADGTGDNDKVEFFFDADASGGVTKEEYDALYAGQYGPAGGWWFVQHADQVYTYDENTSQWVYQIDSEAIETGTQGPGLSWGQNRFPTDGILAAKKIPGTEDGYTMEFAFPWSSLKAEGPFAAGKEIGFNVQVNDFDVEKQRAFFNWIMDYPNANWCDPTVFGKLVLNAKAPANEYVLPTPRAGIKPTIDAQMDEIWQYAMPRAVVIGDPNTEFWLLESFADYFGTFRTLWDADGLYFFFTVYDDILFQDATGDNDKVELFFDADASGGVTQEEYNELYAAEYGPAGGWWFMQHADHVYTYDENTSQWVYQIDSQAMETGTQGPGLSWGQNRFPTEGIQAAVAIAGTEDGYSMEMFFPWTSLKAVAPFKVDDQVGLNIQINDFDEEKKRAFYDWRMIWSNASWCDPTNFGIMALSSMTLLEESSSVSTKPSAKPASFTLEQNYPNPFNPSTTIEFSLPAQMQVKLAVYNVKGEKVAELVNSILPAGHHSISFDGSNLKSGIYVYRLETTQQILSRKFTLLK